MIYYIKGKVEYLKTDSIILETNNIGYQIFVSHVSNYKVNDIIKLYVYNVIKEDANYFIGFGSAEEKVLFLSLIKVNGLGPKTVISALRVTTPEEFKKAIECGNISFLKKLPGISERSAKQIIYELQGKMANAVKADSNIYEEAKNALNGLGFKKTEIDKVLSTINEPNISLNDLIKLALQKLKK